MNEMNIDRTGSPCKCEAFIDGGWIEFDGQAAHSSLKEAKEFYNKWRYIGSTNSLRYDGKEEIIDRKSHIFVK